MEQVLMENERLLMTESLFKEWIITNFGELKEHVVAQGKETRNFEKRFDKMLTRINSWENNINELMELKNATWELHEAYTSFNSQIDQAEGRISEIEDQLNEIKQEGKITEKKSEKEWTKSPKIVGLCEEI